MSGVYSKNNFRSWPFKDLSALQEVSRQLLDQINILRPVSRIKNIQQVIRALDRDGVAILENVVTQQMIQACIDDINTFEEKIPSLEGQIRTKHRSTGGTRDYHVHEYQSDLQVYRSHDPLVFSPNYAKFLMLPEVIEIIRCYLGRSWFYQAMIITRTQAVRWVGKGFDYWHHDARGRKLNIFLLLTDVPDDGSATEVIAGSHKLLYDKSRRIKNGFSDEEVTALMEQFGWKSIFCSAPAGSLVLFDSHALHRGRRSPVARDVFQVNCMTKRSHLWPQEITEEIFRSLNPEQQKILTHRSNISVI